jgi:hypothetical protein
MPLDSEQAARLLIENTPAACNLINEFSKTVLSTRGGRVGSGMGTLLESLWGFYVNQHLKSVECPVEIAWLADHEYNDFACIEKDADWEPATHKGELLRVEAKSMNSKADESKGHFDELVKNLGDWDLLLVLVWSWEPLDKFRVYPKVSDSYIGPAKKIAQLRDALHLARGGNFVSNELCPDECAALPCTHAGEPLNAKGTRERLSGPVKCKGLNVSYAANFGGLVRMLKTDSPEARKIFRRIRAEDAAAHDYISFLHRNYPREEESQYRREDWLVVARELGIDTQRLPLAEVISQVRSTDKDYGKRLRSLWREEPAQAELIQAAVTGE